MASKTDEIVLSYENTLLRKSDFILLDQDNWINDNIISFWFSYLQNQLIPNNADCLLVFPEMSQILKSALYSKDIFNELKVILSTGDYSKKNVLFIPINDCDFDELGGNHWSLLVFYKKRTENPKFEHYDSIKSSCNIESAKTVAKVLKKIYFDDEEPEVVQMPCIKQKNGNDCGIHLLCNVEVLIGQLYFHKNDNLTELANLNMIKGKRQEIKNTIIDLKSKDKLE